MSQVQALPTEHDGPTALRLPSAQTGWRQLLRQLRRSVKGMTGAALVSLAILAAITAPVIAPHSPTKQAVRGKFAEPFFIDRSTDYPLGGDNLGRDIASRVLYGSRASLALGFLVTIAAAIAGGAWFGRVGWPRSTAALMRRAEPV